MIQTEQSCQILNQLNEDYSVENLYKFIELCARTCYKSEDKITVDSAKAFVKKLIENKHLAMLEHGTVYLCMPSVELQKFLFDSPYSKISVGNPDTDNSYYVTTNLRVLVENHIDLDLYFKHFLCKPTRDHFMRYSAKLIVARQIANEFVRHRTFSFAQESSRYCDYSNNAKFQQGVMFIRPSFLENKDKEEINTYLNALQIISETYQNLRGTGNWKTEEVATLLPGITKTELIMTGFSDSWQHFFKLRSEGATGRPHLLAQQIAKEIQQDFLRLNLL